MTSEPQYYELTDELIQDGYLKTPELIESFEHIDRADFVPDDQKEFAHCNTPLAIGFNQTISQPLSVAFMLELLQPKAGEHILDIGAGSGWQTAILADVVSKKTAEGTGVATDSELSLGSVVAVERVPELKAFSEVNIDKYGFIRQNIAQVVLGDGTKGYKNSAPYDKIIASASSEGDVPVLWKRQLKIGGRIVAPVGSSIVVIDKISKLKYTKKEYFGFNFTPLVVS
ncbi:MAG: hypothetical protein ACD_81C00108G0001 [uncultured bacterium]|uniref:Protein-L-isoaspartate O-methyltransferase n=2 Tax=Candidatus Wolfeibacteriota TaxID=1752735 RepID=A0A0G1K7G2_9BACT|nr:MAG: hypothetical protein ACD_81C00108G0001 [uncultured bacterium]KKR12872.1 MAG: L-isoaspartyl protein carboxyl methyltransferase [Candidatus Wolfebacteria bacterium GW2011_GWC2_39_22]KKT43804.1 MAG: L-isoaspartyl protein carboxyl methyltransferase [Candidatus Wolfebacteria bacterium GW2011_GWE2_44_13]HBI25467.1 protein-L-isoaspartate O-methyltransferase [Candidatus Wolfebacteria bacterium]